MELDPKELRRLVHERFSRDLLYMAIHVDESGAARPAAQIAPCIPPFTVSAVPKSYTPSHSGLHLKGLLHHDPKPRARGH